MSSVIALLLGRLRLTVDEAIEVYISLFQILIGSRDRNELIEQLADNVENLLRKCGLSADETFQDDDENNKKCITCVLRYSPVPAIHTTAQLQVSIRCFRQ